MKLTYERNLDAFTTLPQPLPSLADAALGEFTHGHHLSDDPPVRQLEDAIDPVVPFLRHANGTRSDMGKQLLGCRRGFFDAALDHCGLATRLYVRFPPIADIPMTLDKAQMSESEIVDALDQEPLPSSAWQQVASELIDRAGFNDADAVQILHDYAEARLSSGARTSTAVAILAKRLDPTLPEYERSKLYLLGCLAPSGQAFDGYGAEHIFKWAADVGLEEPAVVAAFRRAMAT